MPDWMLAYPGAALSFGSAASRFPFSVAPDIGLPDFQTDDARVARGDGVVFGVDFLGGQTVTFEMTVYGTDEADARSRLGVIRKAWRADAVRQQGGAVAELTSGTGRVTYGRSRRFAANDNLLPFGKSLVTADFACADTLWYGAESSASVSLVPAPGGGLIAPLASPLATTATSDRSTVFTVGGEVPTWPVFEIEGPLTNPVIEIVGLLRMEFRTTLAYDETLVVDTRPWARSILRNGASIAGTLSRQSSRLSQASIPPGSYELVLRGVSDSGTSSVNIRWRDAYLTP